MAAAAPAEEQMQPVDNAQLEHGNATASSSDHDMSDEKTESGAVQDGPAQETPKDRDLDDEWAKDPTNPLNWPTWRKCMLIFTVSSIGFIASAATSILSPGRQQIMDEFNVGSTVALLPVALYVFALGFGPIVGGPLSETVGRLPIYLLGTPLGALFTLGAGFTHNLGVFCFCRFMAGFCWAPTLAVPSASISETFTAQYRGPPSAVFILMPFLGPGLGPVMGSFIVNRKDWRWTQWTIIFFAIFCMLQFPFLRETFNPILRRRLAKKNGDPLPPKIPFSKKIGLFARVALIRPLHMLATEPIVTFLCLYVAFNFGILFSFFAGVPYTFGKVYQFPIEQSGLVFLSIAIGCVLGFITIIACDLFIYRKKIALYPPHKTPPEHRLYPAMIGSLGIPVGLFWFAWTARASVSWASPAVAIMPFAWGNLCVFVSAMQYKADTYKGLVIASAVSANSLARYAFAGAFPLFTIQMYDKMGIDWAVSLLGFVSIALLPIPWILFKYGSKIRAKSKYDTIDYTY